MDTFLVRTLLVPSIAVLLGRWNWWPSRVDVDRPEPPESGRSAGPGVPDLVGPAPPDPA